MKTLAILFCCVACVLATKETSLTDPGVVVSRVFVMRLGADTIPGSLSKQGSNEQLTNRVTNLETSLSLLTGSFDTNYAAFTTACESDITSFCSPPENKGYGSWFFSTFCGQGTRLDQCLVANQNSLSPQCFTGLTRYSNWLSLHSSSYYFSDYSSLTFVFYGLFFITLLSTCCRICCHRYRNRKAAHSNSKPEVTEECINDKKIPTVTVLPISKVSLPKNSIIVKATLVK